MPPTTVLIPPPKLTLPPPPPPPTPQAHPQAQPQAQPLPLPPGLAFRKKILYLTSLKINPTKALTLNPTLRSTPLSDLTQTLTSLTSLGISRAKLSSILNKYPQILTSDPHLTIYPLVEFLLYTCHVKYTNLSFFISKSPRLLFTDIETRLKPTLCFISLLGIPLSHPHLPVLLTGSVGRTYVPKLRYFESVGFSTREVRTLVVRLPALLTYSIERNLKPKVEFFRNEMKGELKEIKRFPQFFAFSLENRIRPRWEIVKGRGVKMELWEMLSVADDEFLVRVLDCRLKMLDHDVDCRGGEGVSR